VLEMEANGKLIVRLFVVVLMLKMLPVVPVETLLIMLLTTIPEEAKFLLASVVTKLLAVKVAKLALPTTDKGAIGVEVPKPTLPPKNKAA